MKLHDVNIANPTRRLLLALLLHGPVAASLPAGLLVLQLLTQLLTAYLALQ